MCVRILRKEKKSNLAEIKAKCNGVNMFWVAIGRPRADPSAADWRSVDEDHAMDRKPRLCIFLLFFFILNADGKLGDLKLCVVGNPRLKSTRTTKYCDLLAWSKRTPVSCVYAADRLECLQAVSKRKADFSVFEAEDLYFSTLWDESSILVVSEIRDLKEKAFQYGVVAMVRSDSNITRIGDLRGKRLCHPGLETGPEWTYLFSQYFEERVAPANCDEDLSVYEDRIKTTSAFFGSACKAGPWSSEANEDARLKNKYWNLCAICDGGDCGASDKYRGSGGSLICFKDGIGDILWARYEDVKAHMKFLESGSAEAESKYNYMCDDGTLMPLTSKEPCFWLAKPWQVVGANRKSATDVQKLMDVLSDDEHSDWEENLLHVIELYLKYIENMLVSRTPEDYLRRIPGYLSASAMSQGNCNPTHSINFCVTSAIEEQKCDWMSKAGSALGIRPSLRCILKPNVTACLDSVSKKDADVVVIAPDFLYEAAINFNLQNFLLETGAHFNDSYLSSVIVKKKSGLKSLSDLKGKKICLTKKHGFGWWTLLSALNQESLISSSCEGLSDYFGELCLIGSPKEQNLRNCCSKSAEGDDEADVLRCLQQNACDAAVLDFNTLIENSDEQSEGLGSKALRLSDFRAICRESDRTTDCHWMWSHPHYLMTHAEISSPKSVEIMNVFFQLGQYFGRNSHKSNPMLEIFGPFHQVENVLFKDTSTSFIESTQWEQSNNYLATIDKMRVCSKSPPQMMPNGSLITMLLIVLCFLFKINSTKFDTYSRLN